MHYRGPRRRREREKGPEEIPGKTIAKKFPNKGKEIDAQVQKVQRVPDRINPRRDIPRHIAIKLTKIKDKEKNIKSNKGKATNTIQGNFHKDIN